MRCDHSPHQSEITIDTIDLLTIPYCTMPATHMVSYADELAPDEIDDFYFCLAHLDEAIFAPIANGYEPIITKII